MLASSALRVAAAPLARASIRHQHQLHASAARPLLSSATSGPMARSARTLFTRAPPSPLAKTRQMVYLALSLAAGTLAVSYYLDSRSGIHRWLIMPVLKATTDPETGQKLAIKLLESGVAPRDMGVDDKLLETELFGKTLDNPIGLAAGFDKQAEAIDGLLDLGFGFVEVGSVTPEPQPGNPQPRYFRLTDDEASINRFGFNSDGHSVVLSRLRDRIRRWLLHSTTVASLHEALVASPQKASTSAEQMIASHPTSNSAFVDTVGLPRSLRSGKLLAVNLGKNKTSKEESVDDYVKGVERLGPFADMIIINVSSPNTPGLRRLQRRDILQDLLTKLVEARNKMVDSHTNPVKKGFQVQVPLLVKIAPDLTEDELHDVADAAVNSGIDGLVISNTTISRPASLKSDQHVNEMGGLSGKPLKPLSIKALQTVHSRLRGKLPIIGCGGIASGQDALDFAKAGASAIELYTAFGYQGVGLPRQIKDELTELLKAEGKTWKQVVGTGVKLVDHDVATTKTLDDAFHQTVAQVKNELDGLKQKLGISVPIAGQNSEEGDYQLIEKVHAALGISSPSSSPSSPSQVESQSSKPTEKEEGKRKVATLAQQVLETRVPEIQVKVKEKVQQVFGNHVEGKIAETNQALDFNKVDSSRAV